MTARTAPCGATLTRRKSRSANLRVACCNCARPCANRAASHSPPSMSPSPPTGKKPIPPKTWARRSRIFSATAKACWVPSPKRPVLAGTGERPARRPGPGRQGAAVRPQAVQNAFGQTRRRSPARVGSAGQHPTAGQAAVFLRRRSAHPPRGRRRRRIPTIHPDPRSRHPPRHDRRRQGRKLPSPRVQDSSCKRRAR